MSWIARYLRLPASEPQKNIVIAFCVIAMSIMSIGLVWQAQIIASQREAIRWLASDDLSLPDQTDRHYAHGDDTEGDDNVLLSFRSREAQIASGPRHGVGLLVLGRCARGPTQNRRQTRYTRPHGPVGQVEGQSWRSACVGYARGKYGKYAGFATNAAFQESNSTALVCKNRDRRETFLPPTSNLCSDAVEKTIPDIRVS